MSERLEKIKNIVRESCAEYLGTLSNGTTLLTVTDVSVTPDEKQATVFISVYPTSGEESALNFAKRHRADMRDHLKKKLSTHHIPFLEIKIDEGEKNRQRIDELLRQG